MLLSEESVYLIDFDRCQLRKPGLWRDDNLVRLRRSLEKVTYGAAVGALQRVRLARAAGRLPAEPGPGRARGLKPRRLRFLYLLAVYLAAPLVSVLFLWRGLRDRSYWQHFRERFGFGPRSARPTGVWLHAVSVGEVQACAPLVTALRAAPSHAARDRHHLHPDGAARARALFGHVAQVRYVPYDLPGAVRRFFRRVQPRLAVIFETELWPNLYRECGRRRIPLVLASARISPRSVGRYRRLGALFRDTLSQAARGGGAGRGRRGALPALGADPAATHVTGNLKFDFELPEDIAGAAQRCGAQYAPGRPLWVAGSTHGGGEEETVLEAQRLVRAAQPRTLLVLAPRHPPRFEEVAQLLKGVRHDASRAAPRPARAALDRSARSCCSTRSASCSIFTPRRTWRSSAAASCRSAATTCSSRPRSACRCSTGPNNFNSADIARLLIARGAAEVVQRCRGAAAPGSELLARPGSARDHGRARARVRGEQPRRAGQAAGADRAAAGGAVGPSGARPAATALAAVAAAACPGGPGSSAPALSGVSTAGDVGAGVLSQVLISVSCGAVEVAGRQPQLQHAHDVVVAAAGVVGLRLHQVLARVQHVHGSARTHLVAGFGGLERGLARLERLAQRLHARDAADHAEVGVTRLALGGARGLDHPLLGRDPQVLGLAHLRLRQAAGEERHRQLQADLAVVEVGVVVEGLRGEYLFDPWLW